MDQLLAKYLKEPNSETFKQLVSPHVDWVYAAALRQVRDAHLAEDITQAVFVLLARKGPAMPPETHLTGWLFNAVRYIARDALKLERRRQRHERLSAARADRAEPWWETVSPILDAQVARLSKTDRQLIVGRFYRDQTYEALAQETSLSAEAVRKRIARALKELRGYLAARAGELPEELDGLLQTKVANSVAPAPLLAAVIAGGGSASSTSVLGLAGRGARTLWWMKAKLAASVAAGLLAAGTAGSVAIHQIITSARPATVARAPAALPAAAQPTTAPVVAATPAREAGLYVSFTAVVDDSFMQKLKVQAHPTGFVEGGGDLFTLANAPLCALLRSRPSDGVLACDDWIERHSMGDGSPRWTLVGGVPTDIQFPLPGGRKIQIEKRGLYQMSMSRGWIRLSLIAQARARTGTNRQMDPWPQPQPTSYRVEHIVPGGQSTVCAVPVIVPGTPKLWLLWIIQSFRGDALDVKQLGEEASQTAKAWVKQDPDRLLLEARRAVLWNASLPESHEDPYYWALPEGGRVKLLAVTDRAVSSVLVWGPDGGRVSGRYFAASDPGTSVWYQTDGGSDTSMRLSPQQTTLRVGYGDGPYTRIIDLPMANVVEKEVDGRLYRLKRYTSEALTMEYDNDPAVDVRFYAVDQSGKESCASQNERSILWDAQYKRAGRVKPGTIAWMDGNSKRVVVEVRKRLWHTFDGIARCPATPAPTDAQVMASLAQPLTLPIPPVDRDQAPDMFQKLRASTIYWELSTPQGRMLRWFGDAAGRSYAEGMGSTLAYDGRRAIWWLPGQKQPLTSRWMPDNELTADAGLSGQDLLNSQCMLADRYPATGVGEEMLDGVQTRVSRGALKDVPSVECTVWRDLTGRLVKLQMGSAATFRVWYDLPAADKWFAIRPEDMAAARNMDAGEEIVQKLCQREAVWEAVDAGHHLRLYEVVAGENGMLYLCYSTQLVAEAAEVVRHAPHGMKWGRGYIDVPWDDGLRQYSPVALGYIHAADVSLCWYALVPNPKSQVPGPWQLHVNMIKPGTPTVQPALAAAGFAGFGGVQYQLPDVDRIKPVALKAYLAQIYGVRSANR